MKNEWIKRYWSTLFYLPIIIVGLILFSMVISQSFKYDDCYSEYSIKGKLVGYANDSAFHYIMDISGQPNWDRWYCSEGFPDDFESYFGHNVKITGGVGCGRRSINSIMEI